ncbi:MAG: anhydro-N-acetylmuramic acid kinase [Proteobacteria bacterium]|nr:anhydro-N-acetylmuramic acid kinase [Pseudomonadota bacterium]MDA1308685.1 anhydro-N-acetylmuramic acid kinase [Pseudomonadota bacterium]
MVKKAWTAIGLMSGTSMDGVDAALITTDGEAMLEPGLHLTTPYDSAFRDRLRDLIADPCDVASVEQELTAFHARAVSALLRAADISPTEVDVIGFHGHTVLHKPEEARTWQIGDGAKLARDTGIDVVYDLRSADVAAGGQGAPLAPVFHRALAAKMPRPLAVLNIGGVANVTWIGDGEDALIGYDTGPGNALLDDWIRRHTGNPFDRDGALGAAGRSHPLKLAKLMTHPYFNEKPPKSLDRDAFAAIAVDVLRDLSVEDGAALLTAFTVETISQAAIHMPLQPRQWIVVGGGRHNQALMDGLRARIDAEITSGDAIGWSGDAVEAQAFGYMAVRSRLGLPISYPGTTGTPRPMSGGVLAQKP